MTYILPDGTPRLDHFDEMRTRSLVGMAVGIFVVVALMGFGVWKIVGFF
jgi:uncharacterized membrane protein